MAVAYSFSREHCAAVEAGTKTRTIRAPRKTRHAKPGDELRLTAPRGDRRTLRMAKCIATFEVSMTISPDGRLSEVTAGQGRYPLSGPHDASSVFEGEDLERFARADGFEDAAAMGRFFLRHHGPGVFRGTMVCWE